MERATGPWAVRANPVTRTALIAGLLLTTAVLTLSDRVPAIIGAIEDLISAEVFDRLDIAMPHMAIAGETLDPGHVVVWFCVAFLTVMIVGRLRWSFLALTVLGVSASGLEVAQRYVTSSRTAHLGDLYSNLVGIGAGALLAGVLTIGVRAVRRSRTL